MEPQVQIHSQSTQVHYHSSSSTLWSIGRGAMVLWHWFCIGSQTEPMQNQCHSTTQPSPMEHTLDHQVTTEVLLTEGGTVREPPPPTSGE